MTDKKINDKTSNKNQISEIHSSLLNLYNYLKVDKMQIVSQKTINKLSILLIYSYAKKNLYQRLMMIYQICS